METKKIHSKWSSSCGFITTIQKPLNLDGQILEKFVVCGIRYNLKSSSDYPDRVTRACDYQDCVTKERYDYSNHILYIGRQQKDARGIQAIR